MSVCTYLIIGTSPLMMHNPQGMTSGGGSTLNKKTIPSAAEEAAAGRYLTDDGYFRFPMQGFKSSLVSGGRGRRLGKQGAAAVLKGTVFPTEDWCSILDAATEQPMKGDRYEIDTRRVTVQMKKSGILR